jgi:hypothetical protein
VDFASLGEEISPPGSVTKKNQKQMVKSAKMFTYIGNIIMADTVQWRFLLNKKGA